MAAHTNVILSRDVRNLGHIGEVVRVRPGYARNYLFPKFLALPALGAAGKQLEHQKKLIEHRRQKLKVASEGLATTLAETQITLTAKSGEQGKLFGSIGTRDIEKGLIEAGYDISHRDIKLEQPIKTLGLHSVEIRLEADVKGAVNVVVVPEVVVEEQPKPAAIGEDEPKSEAE
ncbi:MAG: 50S ribosomal protein L9 [Deltaproteobacteria bacterium]|nr:50S ribosomal protein L9 [Deltaproteobacteria bacterium]